VGFIARVQERLTHAEDYNNFKHLNLAYGMADKAGVQRPRVYFLVTPDSISNLTWQELRQRLPNLFVVRPSVFLNSNFDYFMVDNGPHGLWSVGTDTTVSPGDAMQSQIDNMNAMIENQVKPKPDLLFEEFPIIGDTLCYPVHYRMHMFYGRIGLIQATSRTLDINVWFTPDREVLGSTGEYDAEEVFPSEEGLKQLCSAGVLVSTVAQRPYIRADFVLATSGPMFRSFACMPGDVRSEKYAWFYGQFDTEFEEVWIDAEQRILEDKEHANSPEPDAGTSATPDDNA
jgi:hypothetical protein